MKDFLFWEKIKKINLSVPKSKFKKESFYFFPPIFLILILIAIILVNVSIQKEIEENRVKEFTSSFSPSPYPIAKNDLFDSSANLDSPLQYISANSAVVVDDTSKVILFGKNENLRFSTASTAKIMTALTALAYFKLKDVLTVQTEGVEGSVVGFNKGEKVFFEDLLYGMLLPSGNDAALAIAQNYPGGEEAFVRKMNEKALSLNLFNTHFADPAGLMDDENYSTALDLSRLASFALKNPVLATVVSTKEKIISNAEGTIKYPISNLNKLLGYFGINGVKTGFTDGAGGVLVTSKVDEDTESGKKHTYFIVVMKSKDRFLDTEQILNFIFSGNILYKKF